MRTGIIVAAVIGVAALVGWAWWTSGRDDHRSGFGRLDGIVLEMDDVRESSGLILRQTAVAFSGTETILRFEIDPVSPAIDGREDPRFQLGNEPVVDATEPMFESRMTQHGGDGPHRGFELRLPPMGAGESVVITLGAVRIFGDGTEVVVEGEWPFGVTAPNDTEAREALRVERMGPYSFEIHGEATTAWVVRTVTNTIVYYEVPGQFREGEAPILRDAAGAEHRPSRYGGMRPEAVFPATPFGEPLDVVFGSFFDLGTDGPVAVEIDLGRAMARSGVGRGDIDEPFDLLPGDLLNPDAPAALRVAFRRPNTRTAEPNRVEVTVEGSYLSGGAGAAHRVFDGSGDELAVQFIGTGPHETQIAASMYDDADLSSLRVEIGSANAGYREETFTLAVVP